MSEFDSEKSKKKQNQILIGCVVAIVFFFIVIALSTKQRNQNEAEPVKGANVSDINANVADNVSDKEVWIQQSAQRFEDVQNQVNDLKSQMNAQNKVESDAQAYNQQQFTKIMAALEDIKRAPAPDTPLGKIIPNGKDGPGLPPLSEESRINIEEEPEIISIRMSSESAESSSGGSGIQNAGNKPKNTQTYLPTSFIKAKLITSIDAPCGGTAQDNPFPILLNITDNAQLPNGFRTKTKGCFTLAAGYGEIASERAYFRTEKLSCVMKNGDVIDMKMEGYIVGEDGKAGLRGRLVSKEGRQVALALLSGTVGGLASAFANQATTLQQTSVGTNQYVNPGQSVGFAAANGVSGGFNQLAQYYINLAEKTFPVIEINDQRNVSIVITQGIEFPVNINQDYQQIKSLPISVN